MKEKRILVVEDDKHHAYMLERTLKEEGYKVFVAYNGEEGIKLAKDKRPQVILLDIIMTTEDEGIKVLEEIKSWAPEIEVIMLTAKHDVPTIVKTMRQGAFTYITKPFDNEELKVIIEKAFKYHEMRLELDRKIIELESLFLITEKFVTEELGIEKVLYTMEDLEAFFQCEIGILVLIEDDTLIIKAGIGIPEKSEKEIMGKQIALKEVIENIIQEEKVEIIKDFKEDPIYDLLKDRDIIRGKREIQSILLIPLKGVDIKGFISIYTTHRHEVLEENLPFIKELAKHLKIFTHYIEAVMKAKECGEELANAQKEAELAKKEEELAIAKSEAEIGMITAGFGHELAGILTPLDYAIEEDDKVSAKMMVKKLKRIGDDLRHYRKTMGEFKFSPCLIEDLINNTITQYGSDIEKNTINVIFNPPEKRFKLTIDQTMMEMVFSNLLSNAIDAIKVKKPKKGEIAIDLSVDTSKEVLQISFKDNGYGIRKEDREEIFKEWTSTKQDATGLGLPLAKRIVEKHKGKLYLAETKYGTGSRFVVELPMKQGGEK